MNNGKAVSMGAVEKMKFKNLQFLFLKIYDGEITRNTQRNPNFGQDFFNSLNISN